MSQTEVLAFTRVVVVASTTRIDVALPADIPIVDLLPGLLEMSNELADGDGTQGAWRLSTLEGIELAPARSLRSHGLLDGETLRLMPLRPAIAPAIHDDVVDAVASAVRDRTAGTSSADTPRAAIAVTILVALATLLLRAPTGYAGAGAALVAALGAVLLARPLGHRRSTHTALTLAAAATLPALAAGWLAVPGGALVLHLLLAGAVLLLVSVVVMMFAPVASSVGAAQAIGAVIVCICSLAGVFLGASVAAVLTAASVLALGAMSTLPWLGVRLARLPLPPMPSSADELRDIPLMPQTELDRRAHAGAAIADGTLCGAVVLAAVGAVAALTLGTFGIAYGACVLLLLVLRSRTVASRIPRTVMFTTPLLGALAALGWGGGSLSTTTALLTAAGCALALLGLVVSALTPTRTAQAPLAARWLDLLDTLIVIASVPLAVGALDLYSWARHL